VTNYDEGKKLKDKLSKDATKLLLEAAFDHYSKNNNDPDVGFNEYWNKKRKLTVVEEIQKIENYIPNRVKILIDEGLTEVDKIVLKVKNGLGI
jgi:hypothetical protein